MKKPSDSVRRLFHFTRDPAGISSADPLKLRVAKENLFSRREDVFFYF
jgi:hypothetical protein